MVTALATTSGKVNIGFLSKGSGIRYRQEAVIKTENPVGEAIVWYLPQHAPPESLPGSEWYRIICFVPSGDV
jgi:hypothetical protein